MYKLNAWVQVFLGEVQAKEKEISCRQRRTHKVYFQRKKTTFKTRRRSWGAAAPSSFSSVSKAETQKAAAKQTQGM